MIPNRDFCQFCWNIATPQKVKLVQKSLRKWITKLTFFFSKPLSGKKTESEYS